jgi:hypothetical protein
MRTPHWASGVQLAGDAVVCRTHILFVPSPVRAEKTEAAITKKKQALLA